MSESAVTSRFAESEKERLELEELRLRVRDLRARWWQRPAVLAPLATISAALIGLFWGIASGFFDVAPRELLVSKRELEYQTRELKESRDKQSRALVATTAQLDKIKHDLSTAESLLNERSRQLETQAAATKQLELQEQKLRVELRHADRPVISEAQVLFDIGDGPHVIIQMFGSQFGVRRGKVMLAVHTDCPVPNSRDRAGQMLYLPSETTIWNPVAVTVAVRREDLENTRTQTRRRIRLNTGCTDVFMVTIQRADGRQSNTVNVLIH